MMLIAAYVYLLAILVLVSIGDLKHRKIRNHWSLLNIVNYLVFLFLLGQWYEFSWEMMVFPLIFFIVSFVLFAMKIMGAGDSKFISTFYLTVPVTHHEKLFMIQAALTVMVGIFLLIMNTINNFASLKQAYFLRDAGIFRKVYGKKFPYSPVILISWIVWGLYYGKSILGAQ